MKKVLALLLAVLMLASIGCAWAEGTAVEPAEITFQGIPWGSTYEDTVTHLVACGVIKDESVIVLHETEWFYVLNEQGEMVQVTKEIFPDTYNPIVLMSCNISASYNELNSEFKMGGYAVNKLDFFFINDGTTTQLVSVLALPLPSDTFSDMCLDLVDKLDTVYGKGELTQTRTTPGNYRYSYINIGGECSAVYIYNNKDLVFDFMYGTTDALHMLDEAFEKMPATVDETSSANDTNGL